MKLSRVRIVILAGLALIAAFAQAGDKGKQNEGRGRVVDSGSFGVFVNQKRVATETFSVREDGNGSLTTSEFKTEGTADNAVQTSELQLTPSGDIRKYEWKEISPGKAQATVVPNNEFLMERIVRAPGEKAEEQPYLLPASTSILDDYFFSHRAILMWRYLSAACKQENAQVQCPVNQPVQFGALNPHQRSSMPLSIAFSGRDKVAIHGSERELNKFVLKSESSDWMLWLDDQFKLIRITIPSESTEVVRD